MAAPAWAALVLNANASIAPTNQDASGPPPEYSNPPSPASTYEPDIALDTAASTVQLLRPTITANDKTHSIIMAEVAVYRLTDRVAQEQLNTFRRSFLSIFPLIHLPPELTAAGLRQQKPFFWLVAMALSTKQISQQFAAEETIWRIVSKRIVCEHLVSLDLLLGIICLGSWSHNFKKDKPFMTMLAQMAVSLAFEMDLHRHPPSKISRRCKFGRNVAEQQEPQDQRTLEERRTMLALFHLSSSTWTAYRKTEPMRWTSYMEECLNIMSQGTETPLDIVLATQVKCQIIIQQLDSPSSIPPTIDDISRSPSSILATALMRQLDEIREGLPSSIISQKIVPVYLCDTELMIKKSLIRNPNTISVAIDQSFQRLQNLESVLSSAERWMALLLDLSLSEIAGMDVDLCTRFLHCLVLLFKLVSHDEPGWDTAEVQKRVDVMSVLDRSCEIVSEIPLALGIVDAPGPRRGLLFRTAGLLRALKTLFLAEMQANTQTMAQKDGIGLSGDGSADHNVEFSDEFFQNLLSEEPWLADVFDDTWQGSLDVI
ncbi:hypothetical protein FDECE_1172 [Fusarium decemcellulare]|nr:hypothetical protein FDECE_1172 [Fusarium decemcellulare]